MYWTMSDNTNVFSIMSDAIDERPRRRKPGPKPGGPRHAGMFRKNSEGGDDRRYVPTAERAQVRKTVEELCKQHAEAAVEYLAGLVMDENASEKSRIAACEQILDRGYGTAVNRVLHATVDSGGTPAQAMSLDQLMSQAQRLLKDEDVIDEQ